MRLVRDVLGIVCASITYFLIFWAYWMVLSYLDVFNNTVELIHFVCYSAIVCLAVSCHLQAMLSDPGVIAPPPSRDAVEFIPKNEPQLHDGEWVTSCGRCFAYRPDRTHHCSTCRACVRMMDHHCPWVNNCVGEKNQKFFVLFTCYICVLSVYTLYIIFRHLMACDFNLSCLSRGSKEEIGPLNIMLTVIEGLVFSLFTLIMFCDQMCSIVWDKTTIEKLQYKKDPSPGGSSLRLRNFRRVFGKCSIWCMLPVSPRHSATSSPSSSARLV